MAFSFYWAHQSIAAPPPSYSLSTRTEPPLDGCSAGWPGAIFLQATHLCLWNLNPCLHFRASGIFLPSSQLFLSVLFFNFSLGFFFLFFLFQFLRALCATHIADTADTPRKYKSHLEGFNLSPCYLIG